MTLQLAYPKLDRLGRDRDQVGDEVVLPDELVDPDQELVLRRASALEAAHQAMDPGVDELRPADARVVVDDHRAVPEHRVRRQGGHEAIVDDPPVVAAARELAWWSHCHLSNRDLYRARQAAFARLREALKGPRRGAPKGRNSTDYAFVLRAARLLASCSDSNRMGVAYYERKAAFAQLRGALAVYDRAAER